jgi:hypothetical protein
MSGFQRAPDMEATLQGPHVGTGSTLGLERLRTGRFRVQCCYRRPGNGQVIITGNVFKARCKPMRDTVQWARTYVHQSLAVVAEQLGVADPSSVVLGDRHTDVHVHLDYTWYLTQNAAPPS